MEPGPAFIVCPRCGLRSHHRKDIEEKYCGRCHDWHANMAETRWPKFCFDCGAPLMGGATRHDPGCSIGALIEAVLHEG